MNTKSQIDNVVTVVNQTQSRYSLKRTTISDYGGLRMYDYPYQPESPREVTDKFIMIDRRVRLDQIAQLEYNDPKLWWVIAKVNNIVNPLEILPHGMTLRIPILSTLMMNRIIS